MIRTVKKDGELSAKLTLPSIAYQQLSRVLTALPCAPSEHRYNLTVCHAKAFVWFRVAKVGTRTIFKVLAQSGVDLDAEHAMSCHYPPRSYEGYFKFAFVRNPWDRLVSCWRDKVVDSNHFGFSAAELQKMQVFGNFVGFVELQDLAVCDPHIRLQSRLIDLNAVDRIGRFETFEPDLREVMHLVGLESTSIGRENASEGRPAYAQCYDDELRARVASMYRRDISMFRYEF